MNPIQKIEQILSGVRWESKTDAIYLFRCMDCGRTYLSIGSLHGHIEGHRPFFSWPGDVEALMEHAEILEVTATEQISLDDLKRRGDFR